MSTNDGGHQVGLCAVATRADEMDARDALGKLTRLALDMLPVRYAATAILTDIRAYEAQKRLQYPSHLRHLLHIDPKDPKLDASIADGLHKSALETILKDRTEYEAELGMKPLEPHISIKSIREQKRSARRIRGW